MYKYLFAYEVPEPLASLLKQLMEAVAKITGLPSLSRKLPLHISLHRPFSTQNEGDVLRVRNGTVHRMEPVTARCVGLTPFGRKYLAALLVPDFALAKYWVELHEVLSRFPEYDPGVYHGRNFLHVTVGEDLHAYSESTWNTLQKLSIEPCEVNLDTVVLYRKEEGQGAWSVFPPPPSLIIRS